MNIDAMFITADITHDSPGTWLCEKTAELVEKSWNAAVSAGLSAHALSGILGRMSAPAGTPNHAERIRPIIGRKGLGVPWDLLPRRRMVRHPCPTLRDLFRIMRIRARSRALNPCGFDFDLGRSGWPDI